MRQRRPLLPPTRTLLYPPSRAIAPTEGSGAPSTGAAPLLEEDAAITDTLALLGSDGTTATGKRRAALSGSFVAAFGGGAESGSAR